MNEEDTISNACPEGVGPAGVTAHAAIMAKLIAEGATYTGGCTSFYSPEEWKARGERYGLGSVLIVVYDGGSLGPYFSLDHDYPSYKRIEAMAKVLAQAGFYAEQCTGWYCAIYPN